MAQIPRLESSKTSHQRLLLEWARADWRPPSDLPVWRWCEENVELDTTGPMPGRYSTAVTPMARWVFEAAQDRRVRRVVVMVSAQSSKTLIGILFLLWTIAEDPGPCMWVMANQDHCEEFAKKRLFPAVESCSLTAPLLPRERNARNKRLIQFHSMNLMMRETDPGARLPSDPGLRACFAPRAGNGFKGRLTSVEGSPWHAPPTATRRVENGWNGARIQLTDNQSKIFLPS